MQITNEKMNSYLSHMSHYNNNKKEHNCIKAEKVAEFQAITKNLDRAYYDAL